MRKLTEPLSTQGVWWPHHQDIYLQARFTTRQARLPDQEARFISPQAHLTTRQARLTRRLARLISKQARLTVRQARLTAQALGPTSPQAQFIHQQVRPIRTSDHNLTLSRQIQVLNEGAQL